MITIWKTMTVPLFALIISRMCKGTENHRYTGTFDPDPWATRLLQNSSYNDHHFVCICFHVSSAELRGIQGHELCLFRLYSAQQDELVLSALSSFTSEISEINDHTLPT